LPSLPLYLTLCNVITLKHSTWISRPAGIYHPFIHPLSFLSTSHIIGGDNSYFSSTFIERRTVSTILSQWYLSRKYGNTHIRVCTRLLKSSQSSESHKCCGVVTFSSFRLQAVSRMGARLKIMFRITVRAPLQIMYSVTYCHRI
jgi:hypothetical protein